jgi:hypothetical protein
MHTKCIYVESLRRPVYRARTSPAWVQALQHFDATIAPQGREQAFRRQLADDASRRTPIATFRTVRSLVAKRYAVLMNASAAYHAAHPQHKSSEDLLKAFVDESSFSESPGWQWAPTSEEDTARKRVGRTRAVAKGSWLVSYESFKGQETPIDALRGQIAFAVQHDYTMVDGFPEMGTPLTRILAVGELPLEEDDPFKLLRAAAFAGWAMMAVESPAEATRALHDLEADLKRT